MSLVEALQTLSSATASLVSFPMFGLAVTFRQNLAIGMVFTKVSLVRSYTLRQLLEALQTCG